MKRSALAFRAFNVELSQVIDVTSQPVAVQGRYLFWSEVIDEIFSNDTHRSIKNQPIADELYEVHNNMHFHGLIAILFAEC